MGGCVWGEGGKRAWVRVVRAVGAVRAVGEGGGGGEGSSEYGSIWAVGAVGVLEERNGRWVWGEGGKRACGGGGAVRAVRDVRAVGQQ